MTGVSVMSDWSARSTGGPEKGDHVVAAEGRASTLAGLRQDDNQIPCLRMDPPGARIPLRRSR
jgi:hypothetical protein